MVNRFSISRPKTKQNKTQTNRRKSSETEAALFTGRGKWARTDDGRFSRRTNYLGFSIIDAVLIKRHSDDRLSNEYGILPCYSSSSQRCESNCWFYLVAGRLVQCCLIVLWSTSSMVQLSTKVFREVEVFLFCFFFQWKGKVPSFTQNGEIRKHWNTFFFHEFSPMKLTEAWETTKRNPMSCENPWLWHSWPKISPFLSPEFSFRLNRIKKHENTGQFSHQTWRKPKDGGIPTRCDVRNLPKEPKNKVLQSSNSCRSKFLETFLFL